MSFNKNNQFDISNLDGGLSGTFSNFTSGSGSNPTTPTTPVLSQFEFKRSLYDTGLQNIFNDYQKNIATLSQREQESLQDAYFVREMSKKYLGEYASNVGMGDVSGNLLDIYGQYQQNISQINQQFGELELNLEREFQQEKASMLENILTNEYNIQLDALEDNARNVLFAIETGNTQGMSDFQYLQNQYDNGLISEEDYQSIYGGLYTQTLNQLTSGLTTGYYGYKTDDEGNRVRITDPQEFVEQYRGVLSESDFTNLQDQVAFAQEIEEANKIDVVDLRDPSSTNYQPDLDPSFYIPNENVGTNSLIFEIEGMQYVQILDRVDEDENATTVVDEETLFNEWDSDPNNEGLSLANGDIYDYRGTKYVFQNGAWYRMASSTGKQAYEERIEQAQSNWKSGGTSTFGEYNRNKFKKDTLTLDGVVYTETSNPSFDFYPQTQISNKIKTNLSEEEMAIVMKFAQVHGDNSFKNVPRNSVIYFNGKFYVFNANGLIREMKK